MKRLTKIILNDGTVLRVFNSGVDVETRESEKSYNFYIRSEGHKVHTLIIRRSDIYSISTSDVKGEE